MTVLDANADWQALLRTIREHPLAALPRLVAADWLDENATEANGFAEYAEFIRLMCDGVSPPLAMWHKVFRDGGGFQPRAGAINVGDSVGWFDATDGYGPAFDLPRGFVRNGFVEEVRTTLAWWLGDPCGECGGRGIRTRDFGPDYGCRACDMKGSTPAHGPEVVARHPVTRVVVTDREPWQFASDRAFGWFREDGVANYQPQPGGRRVGSINSIPSDVFSRFSRRYGDQTETFLTRADAEAALSRALVGLAREAAGLPPIAWEVSQ